MKIAKILITLILVLPLILIAQNQETSKARELAAKDCDWIRDNEEGVVQEISGDSILYEEQWIYPSPLGMTVSSSDVVDAENESIHNFEAPFWAEVTFYRKNMKLYMLSIRIIQQMTYDSDGNIIYTRNDSNK